LLVLLELLVLKVYRAVLELKAVLEQQVHKVHKAILDLLEPKAQMVKLQVV
jgi:hypothetical protein